MSTPGPPKGSSHTNILPLGQRKSKPDPFSQTNLSVNLPAQLSDTSLDNTNLTQRDPEGPDYNVAFALNDNTFGINAQGGGGDVSTHPYNSSLLENSRHENNSDSYIAPNQVMMSSLRNKNKKKGFKLSMANPLPQKIIFTSNTTASSGSQQPPSLMAEPSTTTSSETIQPRLIPPSEIQELGLLPSNMFVTSVDVESGMWDEHLPLQKKQQQDKKKKQKNLNNNNSKGRHSATTDSSQKDITFDENGQFDDAHDDTLPYFDTDVQNITTTTQAPSSLNTTLKTSRPFDWDRVESLWEECEVLEKLEQLVVGCLVGWKVC